MDGGTTIISIVVVIILGLVLGVIFWIMLQNPTSDIENSDPPLVNPPPPVSILYSCSVSDPNACGEGLICDPYLKACKLEDGQMCFQASDCASNSYCSGICINRNISPEIVTKNPTDPCPCSFGLQCVDTYDNSGLNVCRGIEGFECNNNEDCVSNLCVGNLCSGLLDNLEECVGNSTCKSGNCSEGWCQPANIITFDQGALCSGLPSGPGCSDGLTCSTLGECVPATSGLMYSCGGNVGCPNYMNCYNIPSTGNDGTYPPFGSPDGFGPCQSDDINSCACFYSFDSEAIPTPNNISNLGSCSSGFKPTNEGFCGGLNLQPCFYPGSEGGGPARGGCAEGLGCTATSSGMLYRIDFEFQNLDEELCYPIQGTVGAHNFSYTPVTVIDNITPVKMIGSTAGYSPPIDPEDCSTMQRGTDNIYMQTLQGEVNPGTYPDNFVVLWKWDGGVENSNFTPFLNFVITDVDGIRYQFMDASTFDKILVAGFKVLNGTLNGKYVLRGYNFETQVWFNYITTNGVQKTEGGDNIKFDRLSITSSQNPSSNFASVLLVHSSSEKVYYNRKSTTFKDRSDMLRGSNVDQIELMYGVDVDNSSQIFSYPVMSFVSGSIGNRYIRFSKNLDDNSKGTYNSVLYPSPAYGANFTQIDVDNYSIARVNPIATQVQNGIFGVRMNGYDDGRVYTISSGAQINLPGHFSKYALYLATTKALYVWNPFFCKTM